MSSNATAAPRRQRHYIEASDVASAVAAMRDGARPIAGGTDLVVGARHGKAPLPDSLVGIHRIAALGAIDQLADGGLRLGALVSHATLQAHPAVVSGFTGVADASAIVGSHATRATGTVGGNVMNASPAMDTGAPLLCHNGVAVLVGPSGERRVALADLWVSPGRTCAAPDELLVAVELEPASSADGATSGSAYVRLQYRRQMEIAIVGAGAVVTLGPDGTVTQARISITALAPVIHRVPEAESAFVGSDGGFGAAKNAGSLAAAAARPISDVRGSAHYRTAMAAVITRRALLAAVRRARGEHVPVPASDTTFGS